MLPPKYALDNATTQAQVLRRLASFVEYLRSCHVDSALPHRFATLSAGSAGEVRDWTKKLGQRARHDYCLGAVGRCWIEQVLEAFTAASLRLDELEAGQRQSAVTPGKRIQGDRASSAAGP